MPTDVTYTALGFSIAACLSPLPGAWLVASRAPSTTFCGTRCAREGRRLRSRVLAHPHGQPALTTCIATRMSTRPSSASARQAWLSRFSASSDPEMDGYIVPTVGPDAIEAPASSRGARTATCSRAHRPGRTSGHAFAGSKCDHRRGAGARRRREPGGEQEHRLRVRQPRSSRARKALPPPWWICSESKACLSGAGRKRFSLARAPACTRDVPVHLAGHPACARGVPNCARMIRARIASRKSTSN